LLTPGARYFDSLPDDITHLELRREPPGFPPRSPPSVAAPEPL
jgi:hypothetical protein